MEKKILFGDIPFVWYKKFISNPWGLFFPYTNIVFTLMQWRKIISSSKLRYTQLSIVVGWHSKSFKLNFTKKIKGKRTVYPIVPLFFVLLFLSRGIRDVYLSQASCRTVQVWG